MIRLFKLFFLILFSIIFIIFTFSNTEIITINFLFFEIKIRLFLLIVIVFIFGLIFANCINYFKHFFNKKSKNGAKNV